MNKRDQIFLLCITFFTMTVVAISVSYRGLLLPTFKNEFSFNNSQAGFFISIASLTSMIFSFYGGKYCNRLGQKRIIHMGNLITACSCVGVFFAKSFTALTLSFVGIACGTALIILALNTVLPMITLAAPTVLMNILHFFYGFGTTITQKAVAIYLGSGFSWRWLFIFIAVVFVFSSILFQFVKLDKTNTLNRHRNKLPYVKFSWLIITALSCYVVSEFLASSWLINYFKEGYHFTETRAAYYTTLFFLTFTLGRLFGGFIMDKLEFLTGVIICTASASITMLIGVSLGQSAFVMIGLSGLFYSVVYPTVITLANYVFKEQSPYFIGLLSTVTAITIFAFNLLFGFLNDVLGVIGTFYMIPLLMGVSTLLFVLAKKERLTLGI